MTFSNFINLLYKHIGGDMSRTDFLMNLTTMIMVESFPEKEHPFSEKSQDMLGRIFNGSKKLPQRDARLILKHIDEQHFVDCLLELPPNAITSICKDMQEVGLTVSDENVIDNCTDLFRSILTDCANGVRASSTEDSKKKKASQSGTPSEQMIKIFKLAILDCDVISTLRIYDPGGGATREAIRFLETIQTEIEHNSFFGDYQSEETYQNIVAFAYAVDQYNRALNTREHSTISSYKILDMEIRYIWKRLVTLYGEICGSNTLFADQSPI